MTPQTVEPLRIAGDEAAAASAAFPVIWPIVAGCAVLVGLAAGVMWFRRRGSTDPAEAAFARLARDCGLSADERAAVREGARTLNIDPAGLLLSDAALASIAAMAENSENPAPVRPRNARTTPAAAGSAEATPTQQIEPKNPVRRRPPANLDVGA